MRLSRKAAALGAAVAFALAACSSSGSGGSAAPSVAVGGPGGTLTPVKFQLQWVAQSQFAGYYAALDEGFYEARCLDVTILEGAVDIVPQQVLASGGAEFGIAWVPKALVSREAGADIVNIAQVFQRSGTLMVSWKDSGITSPEDWAGKKVGNWGFGNEYEIFAALAEEGLDPSTDVTLVGQQFDMVALLDGTIDAATKRVAWSA